MGKEDMGAVKMKHTCGQGMSQTGFVDYASILVANASGPSVE